MGHRLGELKEPWSFMTVFPRYSNDTLPSKTCCVLQPKNGGVGEGKEKTL